MKKLTKAQALELLEAAQEAVQKQGGDLMAIQGLDTTLDTVLDAPDTMKFDVAQLIAFVAIDAANAR